MAEGDAPASDVATAHQSSASRSLHAGKATGDQHPRKDGAKDRKHRHRHASAAPLPLLADARAECILSAARRLGRLRAGIVAGYIKEHVKPTDDAGIAPHPHTTPTHHTTIQRSAPEGHAGSSSPPVPLAASSQGRGTGSRGTQRRLAPSPFTTPGSSAPMQHMPAHLHPSMQAYAGAAQGTHLHQHALPHPFVYLAPGPGLVPYPWAMPGTPPTAQAQVRPPGQARGPAQGAGSQASHVRTPARDQASVPAAGSSTPMDSLVNAARTLIGGQDYDSNGGQEIGAQRIGGGPAEGETEETADEDAAVVETPIRRRGTRRRAPEPAPDTPLPKRRRTAGTANASQAVAGPSTTPSSRRAKQLAAAPSSESPEKPRARGRAKGKAKAAPEAPPATASTSAAQSTSVPHAPPAGRVLHAPQVARMRSALDVLADQAAQEQERRPATDVPSTHSGEGEGVGVPEAGGVETDTEETRAKTPSTPAPPPSPPLALPVAADPEPEPTDEARVDPDAPETNEVIPEDGTPVLAANSEVPANDVDHVEPPPVLPSTPSPPPPPPAPLLSDAVPEASSPSPSPPPLLPPLVSSPHVPSPPPPSCPPTVEERSTLTADESTPPLTRSHSASPAPTNAANGSFLGQSAVAVIPAQPAHPEAVVPALSPLPPPGSMDIESGDEDAEGSVVDEAE
ncbi:hypothetical protein C8Q77DRAFT_440840 [Trametes polyzona]|nr:hypothetical protein C8Q77DRAFT_440840 [Trametes polyzona]